MQLLLLAALLLAPMAAWAKGPAPKKPAPKHKGPAVVVVCGTDCPSGTFPSRRVAERKCGSSGDDRRNASICTRIQGDEYVACGELCGMNYTADTAHPAEPSEACGKYPRETGPAVRCQAMGAPAPSLVPSVAPATPR